jgi:hypothetical protein
MRIFGGGGEAAEIDIFGVQDGGFELQVSRIRWNVREE